MKVCSMYINLTVEPLLIQYNVAMLVRAKCCLFKEFIETVSCPLLDIMHFHSRIIVFRWAIFVGEV